MKRALGTLIVVCLALACNKDRREESARTTQPSQSDRLPTPMPATVTPAPTLPGGAGTLGQVGTPGMLGVSGSGGALAPASDKKLEAEAEFEAAKGYKLKGEANFEEVAGGVKVVVEVKDGPPGKRGIHVHEKGDCSDIAGKSMGEHFNPTANPHALPPSSSRHLGDLGNILVDKQGKGKLELVLPNANLKEGTPLSLLQRSLVIHEDEDDGSQPSGASGKPIACAVIKKD